MSLFKKKKKDELADVPVTDVAQNVEEDAAADVDAVMRKYDRESATRIWEGKPKLVIRSLMALFSLYCIYMTLFSTAIQEVRLSAFLGFVVLLGFLPYPAKKGSMRVNHIPWYDIVLMFMGVVPLVYFAINAESIIQLALKVTSPRNPDYYQMISLAIMALLSLMELCRRCVGIPILCVVGALLIYALCSVSTYCPS